MNQNKYQINKIPFNFQHFLGFFQYFWPVIDLSNISMNLDEQNKHTAEDLIQKFFNIYPLQNRHYLFFSNYFYHQLGKLLSIISLNSSKFSLFEFKIQLKKICY